MSDIRHAIGIDISTQAVAAMLIGVVEDAGRPCELVVSSAWVASRGYDGPTSRRTPSAWVETVRECIADLHRSARETTLARAIGVSTTFPGTFPIACDGTIDPALVSLYDNTDDADLGGGRLEHELGRAEEDTLNRMWPGNMAIGLARLVRSSGLCLNDVAALVPKNTAFAHALLRAAGCDAPLCGLVSDLTETIIGGLYEARSCAPMPEGVAALFRAALPEIDPERVRRLLPHIAPSWRNAVPASSLGAVRKLLDLPDLQSVSIGAGDSPLGTMALSPDRDTILCVRGSTDSPMLQVDAPLPRHTQRETVLHYPMPWATCAADEPWCVVAPTLRSGKVWDWVKRLRFDDSDAHADVELEKLALEALRRRLRAPEGSLEHEPILFDTALGGERAPEWNPRAVGTISGLIETHDIGDIALAALEGMSVRLRRCLSLMEQRYGVSPSKLLLAGGPVHNTLWNWITQAITGKRAYVTTFADASLLGAAMLGYGASYDGAEDDPAVSRRLRALSSLAAEHPLIQPSPVKAPDEELAAMEQAYAEQAEGLCSRT